jgi:hypothetical protein
VVDPGAPVKEVVMLDIPQERIDWRAKGFWLPDTSLTAAEVAAARPRIFDGGFTWPLLVIRESAVRANIATMAAYCARHGVDFAPHAKTTMAPGLLAAQFEAGAGDAPAGRAPGVPGQPGARPDRVALAGRGDGGRLGGVLPGGLGRRGAGRGGGRDGRDRTAACRGGARAFRRADGRAYDQ